MNFYIKSFIVTAILTTAGYFIHSYIVSDPVISILKTYLFLGFATYLTVAALKFTSIISPDNLGYLFLGLMSIKLGAILIFFPQLMDSELDLNRSQLLGFLIPYLLFLFAEIGIVLKWLNDS